jgi:hypothetical protein
MSNWKPMLTTIVTVFVSAALSAAAASQFNFTTQWKVILVAGVTAVLTYVINVLNPGYAQYGIGKK